MALACDDQFAAWFGPNAARTARKACNDQLGEVQTLLELQGRHVMASLVLGLVQTLLELQGRHVMTSLVLGLVQTPLELQGRHVMTSLLLGLVQTPLELQGRHVGGKNSCATAVLSAHGTVKHSTKNCKRDCFSTSALS